MMIFDSIRPATISIYTDQIGEFHLPWFIFLLRAR
jgi:hypothetical protein